jgi:hypothetical protein
VLQGDQGNYILKGAKGNDYLDGSKGIDILVRGKGAESSCSQKELILEKISKSSKAIGLL